MNLSLTDLIGLAGQGLLLAACLLALPPLQRLRPLWRVELAVALVLLAALPLAGGLSVAQALRGAWGDLSPTTLLLCLLALPRRDWLGGKALKTQDRRQHARPCPPFCDEGQPTAAAWEETGPLSSPTRRLVLSLVLLGGVMLYPASLASGDVDPYRWGFAPWGLLAVVGTAGLAGCSHYPGFSLILGVDLLAYALRLTGSDNLWDYLVDPLLVTYALFATLLAPAFRRRLAFFRRRAA